MIYFLKDFFRKVQGTMVSDPDKSVSDACKFQVSECTGLRLLKLQDAMGELTELINNELARRDKEDYCSECCWQNPFCDGCKYD